MPFVLTEKQEAAQALCASQAIHIMLFGGSRSGKTFLLLWCITMRALMAPKSRHAILRFRFNHIKSAIVLDTFPKMMELAFPQVKYALNKTDWYVTLPNGSEIWFGGLDDKERTEKILGNEYSTVFLNECSQISYSSRNIILTRLAQKVSKRLQGKPDQPLPLRFYYDCNPPTKGHWTYKLFIEKRDPETKQLFTKPENFASMQINPMDNKENLPDGYIGILESQSPRLKKRFLFGEYADENPNALFTDETIELWRHITGALPQMVRVVIGVDPSGSGDVDNADNDAIGIAVVALGQDGNAYVLEDCTVKAGPATWGRVATDAYDRHQADVIVGETNFGGAMVEYTIQTTRPRTPYKAVTASRGKSVRAEPISSLYEQGKVRHVGYFRELEDELTAFSTIGYIGNKSPNRADALIWALSELFPGLVQAPAQEVKKFQGVSPFRQKMGFA